MTNEAQGKTAAPEKKTTAGSSSSSSVAHTSSGSGTMSVLPYLFQEDKVTFDVTTSE